jgi:hypothetical protein
MGIKFTCLELESSRKLHFDATGQSRFRWPAGGYNNCSGTYLSIAITQRRNRNARRTQSTFLLSLGTFQLCRVQSVLTQMLLD